MQLRQVSVHCSSIGVNFEGTNPCRVAVGKISLFPRRFNGYFANWIFWLTLYKNVCFVKGYVRLRGIFCIFESIFPQIHIVAGDLFGKFGLWKKVRAREKKARPFGCTCGVKLVLHIQFEITQIHMLTMFVRHFAIHIHYILLSHLKHYIFRHCYYCIGYFDGELFL